MLLQYCYITVLSIYGLTVMLFVQGRVEMAVLPEVTVVLLHHSTMDIWTDCNIVTSGWRGNYCSGCSYSTLTSHCYVYMV